MADAGFYGRPKSAHKSHLFNGIHTGGMGFPEGEGQTVAVRDGMFIVVPIEHDEHRPFAREERKAERAQRKNAKARIERRIHSRALKLQAKDPELDLETAIDLASIQIAKLIKDL